MPRKTDPKWGWQDAAGFESAYIKDADFAKISAILNVEELNDEIQDILRNIILEYLAERQRQPQIPNQSEIKAALGEIQSISTKLVNALTRIDTVSKNRLEAASLPNQLGKMTAIFDSVEKGDSEFHILLDISQKALDDLVEVSAKRPLKKAPIRKMISELAILYEQLTHKKATLTWDPYGNRYSGAFFKLTSAILEMIDPTMQYENNALGKLIQRILQRKNKPQNRTPTLDVLKRVPTILEEP